MQQNSIHKHVAPVVLFCYNRPKHLRQTLEALLKNDLAAETVLYIFSDGSGSSKEQDLVDKVHKVVDRVTGFKETIVKKSSYNRGLANSVIFGVGEVLNNYDRCIVLEDDLETSPFFLRYMNQALEYYGVNDQIFSISGYCPPISIPDDYSYPAFLFPRINSWGWGTWRDRWDSVDWEVKNFDNFISSPEQRRVLSLQGKDLPVMLLKQQQGEIGSWAVRFNQACFEQEKTNVYPVKSLVRNLGIDGTGTHMKSTAKYSVDLTDEEFNPFPAGQDQRISKSFRNFYNPSLFRRVLNKIKIACYQQKTP